MKTYALIYLLAGSFLLSSAYAEDAGKTWLCDSPPVDMESAVKCLKEKLPASDLKEFKETPHSKVIAKYHHSFGRQIRNNWGLWGGSELQKRLLNDGYKHPDDISSAIMEKLYQELNEQ
jgi:hypothetical protein